MITGTSICSSHATSTCGPSPRPFIANLPLTGNTTSPDFAALLTAVQVLRELNIAGRTTVPQEATTDDATSFVPARWRGYLNTTRGQGRGAAYRHYWELSARQNSLARALQEYGRLVRTICLCRSSPTRNSEAGSADS